MSNHMQSSPTPAYPFQWGESVLSTRSLSYLSTSDSLGSPGFLNASGASDSRTTGLGLRSPPARRSTYTDDSDNDLHMATTKKERAGKGRNHDLPDSVAESPLFRLPREIRDRIYSYCLTVEHGVPVEWPPIPGSNWRSALQPQLVRTCKSVYDAAAPLLYTDNDFTFHHPSDANMFVRAIASPIYSRYITSLSLHIKAQDIRLWKQYLIAPDEIRSLKSDFPNIKELSVRLRGTKWSHTTPAEVNLNLWADDTRLDEILEGLGDVYFPALKAQKGQRVRDIQSRRTSFPAVLEIGTGQTRPTHRTHDPDELMVDAQSPDARRPSIPFSKEYSDAPIVRLICACRVHHAHFTALTGVSPPVNADGVIIHQRDADVSMLGTTQGAAVRPVREGEEYRGYSVADLRTRDVKRLYDAELGSANVARTPFTYKDGILIALEIHCLDPTPEAVHVPTV